MAQSFWGPMAADLVIHCCKSSTIITKATQPMLEHVWWQEEWIGEGSGHISTAVVHAKILFPFSHFKASQFNSWHRFKETHWWPDSIWGGKAKTIFTHFSWAGCSPPAQHVLHVHVLHVWCCCMLWGRDRIGLPKETPQSLSEIRRKMPKMLWRRPWSCTEQGLVAGEPGAKRKKEKEVAHKRMLPAPSLLPPRGQCCLLGNHPIPSHR